MRKTDMSDVFMGNIVQQLQVNCGSERRSVHVINEQFNIGFILSLSSTRFRCFAFFPPVFVFGNLLAVGMINNESKLLGSASM